MWQSRSKEQSRPGPYVLVHLKHSAFSIFVWVGGMARSDLAELLARDKADSKAKSGKWKRQVPQVIKCHLGISWNICKIDA